jgi:hypothetical protein
MRERDADQWRHNAGFDPDIGSHGQKQKWRVRDEYGTHRCVPRLERMLGILIVVSVQVSHA